VLAVTARADNPLLAARIANAFVQGAFESRKQVLGPLVRAMLAQTQASLQGLTATSPLAPDLAARANSLRSIQDGTDPTLSVSQPAEPPTSPKGLPKWVLVVLALLAGAALGVGTAVVTELVRGQRVIDEDQLDAITGLPVLARVPRAASELRRTPAADAPVAVTEAFRSLVFQLELGGRQPRSIMVASASRGDGKTTSVAQLGQTLAASGQDVLLIDFDLRNPKLAQELVVEPERDLWQVVSDGGNWKNAVTEVEGREGLRLLVAGSRGDDPGFLAEWVVYVLRDAVAEFDCVIVDTPPLAEVSDALKLSGVVDSILLVTRLSRTPTRSLEIATELLQRTGRPVAGVVLFGSNGHRAAAYMRSARY
jgi:capsular exopolysaccharide synthesis family protein